MQAKKKRLTTALIDQSGLSQHKRFDFDEIYEQIYFRKTLAKNNACNQRKTHQ